MQAIDMLEGEAILAWQTCDGCDREEHVYAVVCVYAYLELVFLKHGFQPCMIHGTLAQSGAQTINTLL